MARLLLEAHDIAKSFGARVVLKSVGFTLAPGQKVGWIGPNGCGKSTLLGIVAGIIEPDAGRVHWHDQAVRESARQALVPQSLDVPDLEVSSAGVGTGELPPAAREYLGKLGFGASLFGVPWRALSGGEKIKLLLARALAHAGEIILLDEPTNHLDLPAVLWLEEWLLRFRGAAIVISHDRRFLDRVVTRIDELDEGVVRSFPGNYSAYAAQKRREWETAWQEYRAYQAKKKQLERAARDRQNWFRQAHHDAGQNDFWRAKAKKGAARASAIRRRLEKLEEKPRPKEKPVPRMELKPDSAIGARFAVRGEDVGKCFETGLDGGCGGSGPGPAARWVLRGVRFYLEPGARAVLMGPNGSGKTTLLEIIAGVEQPSEGSVAVSPQAKVGYLAQELENLAPDRTVIDEVLAVSIHDRAQTRNLLASLLFRGEEVQKRIGILSAGEMVRVALAKLLVGRYNLLLLDEPTNHLDAAAREAVEQALVEFDGTILAASHDRYFTSRIATEVWALVPGSEGMGGGSTLVVCRGGLEEYLRRLDDNRRRRASDDEVRATDASAAGDRLLLESRLAHLGGLLATKGLSSEEYAALENEYLATARALADAKRRRGASNPKPCLF